MEHLPSGRPIAWTCLLLPSFREEADPAMLSPRQPCVQRHYSTTHVGCRYGVWPAAKHAGIGDHPQCPRNPPGGSSASTSSAPSLLAIDH